MCLCVLVSMMNKNLIHPDPHHLIVIGTQQNNTGQSDSEEVKVHKGEKDNQH